MSFLRISQINRDAHTVKRNVVSLGSARTVHESRGNKQKAQKVNHVFGSHEPSTQEYAGGKYLSLTYRQSESEVEKADKTRVDMLRIRF